MRYVAVSAITFIFGMSLIVLGVPRTIGAFVSFPSGPILSKIQFQKPIQQNEVETLIASQESSLFWGETGRKWTDLGLAQLLMAEQMVSDKPVRQSYITVAIVSLQKGLGLAPANPFAWMRLAYAEVLKEGPSRATASALIMSMLTAPFEPRLLFLRLELSFRTWSYFQSEDREMVFEQIRYAWHDTGIRWLKRRVDKKRDKLVQLAMRTNRVNLVRAALLKTSADLSEFERRLRNHLS